LSSWTVSKPFRIGMNCDADKQFNNDPKDPNKYEIEGLKTQSTGVQVCDYLMKMVEEHPLITYIEDPMAEGDAESIRKLKCMLLEKAPSVMLGLKSAISACLDKETML